MGCMIQLSGALVAWCPFKQRCVAASSTEEEYVFLTQCIQKVQYFYRIIGELGGLYEPTVIAEDNRPYIIWATEKNKNIKEVDVRSHICRKAAMNGEVKLEYIPTTAMTADMVTKPLGFRTFHDLGIWCHPGNYSCLLTRTENNQFVEAECWNGETRSFRGRMAKKSYWVSYWEELPHLRRVQYSERHYHSDLRKNLILRFLQTWSLNQARCFDQVPKRRNPVPLHILRNWSINSARCFNQDRWGRNRIPWISHGWSEDNAYASMEGQRWSPNTCLSFHVWPIFGAPLVVCKGNAFFGV